LPNSNKHLFIVCYIHSYGNKQRRQFVHRLPARQTNVGLVVSAGPMGTP